MRIAAIYPHVSVRNPSSPNNALAVLLWETSRRLAMTDESVLVVGDSPGAPRSERIHGVRVVRIPILADQVVGQLRRLDGLVFRDPQRPFRSTALYYRVFAARAAHHLGPWMPDIVHVHAIPNFLPLLRRKLPSARLVLHAHDHRLADYEPEVIETMAANADLILGCSRSVAGSIARQFPNLADRCSHVHNGVDDKFLAVGRRRRFWPEKLLFVGRVSPEKGVHTLIEAFRSVAAEFPGATLDIVGPRELAPLQFVDPRGEDPKFDGLRRFYGHSADYDAYLRSLIPSRLFGRIRFRGSIPNTALGEEFSRAGIFVFPSIWQEPFGMPVVEAMGCGLPVIATDAGAFPETIAHGRTGLLVERGNVEALAAALRRLLASDKERARMGTAGYERARSEFGWDTIVARLREQYRSLLAGGPQPRPTGVIGRPPATSEPDAGRESPRYHH